MSRWAIYGATGYSGGLASELAVELGEEPLLLGRSKEKLASLAADLGLDHAVAPLEDEVLLRKALEGFAVLVNAAGPFASTWQPLVEACLDVRTSYLDITGEVAVMEALRKIDDRARERRITVMPGVGFDVIPSDCLAVHLKNRLPDATHLTLAIGAVSRPSRGTATSVAARLAEGSLVRRHGLLVDDDPATHHMHVDFGWDVGAHDLYRLQWGDLSTAHHSTGIHNIETYLPLDRSALRAVRMMSRAPQALVESRPAQSVVVRALNGGSVGPTAQERAGASAAVWAEVTNGRDRLTGRVLTPHPYSFTAMGMVESARRVATRQVEPGFQTPATAFGADYILDFDGTKRAEL